MSNESKEIIKGIAASWAEMTIAEKREALEVDLNEEIATTKSSWVKTRNRGYLLLLGFANEWLLNTIYKAL